MESARTGAHPDLKDLGDTFYSGPCTDVNADVSQSVNTVKTHNTLC